MHNKILILYNIRINSRNRLKRLAFHLASMTPMLFKDNLCCLINVRGIYKHEAEGLFRNAFHSPIFFTIHSDYGWKADTAYMLDKHTFDYILWMIEDTYLIGASSFNVINFVDSACKNNIDFIPMSQYGASALFKDNSSTLLPTDNYLSFYNDTALMNEQAFQARSRVLRSNWETYPIWAFGIYSQPTFYKLLSLSDRDDQLFTPFGMEVPPPLANFPCRIAFPRNQLFVTYDDDQGFLGDSLLSRGLYNDTTNQTLLRMHEDHIDHQRGIKTCVTYD